MASANIMSLQVEIARKTTQLPLGKNGAMVLSLLPSQEALLTSKHWPAAAREVEKLADGWPVKFLSGGRDKVVLDIGQGKVAKLLPTTPEDGIGLEKAFRRAVEGVGLEAMVVPLIEEFMVGDILVQVQPKLRMDNIRANEVRQVRSELARYEVTWVDGDERNLGRMEDGTLVIIDGSLKWRGLGERIVEALSKWTKI